MEKFTIELKGNDTNTRIDNDYTIVAKCNNQVIGYTQLIPIGCTQKRKALWINKCICNNSNALIFLIKETLMLSWEMGFDAIFSNLEIELPKGIEYSTINRSDLSIALKPDKVLAFELSWEGFKKFERRN
jgi:hypothetical protein